MFVNYMASACGDRRSTDGGRHRVDLRVGQQGKHRQGQAASRDIFRHRQRMIVAVRRESGLLVQRNGIVDHACDAAFLEPFLHQVTSHLGALLIGAGVATGAISIARSLFPLPLFNLNNPALESRLILRADSCFFFIPV